MKKNLLLKIAVSVASFGVVLPVFAHGEETTNVPPPIKPIVRQEIENIRQDAQDARKQMKEEVKDIQKNAREELKNTKQEIKTDVKELRDTSRAEMESVKATGDIAQIEAKRMEIRAAQEQRMAEFKQKLEDSKKELKERVDAKKQELKDRLASIKDEKKKATVEKIDGRLDELNAKYTEHYSEVLTKLGAVVEKINVRIERAAARGLDVSAVRTALISADAAIAASKTAIESQTAKTYLITVTDEATLRENVGAARQALRADLKAVEQTVKDAREATRKAATTLAGIQGINDVDTQSTTAPATTETGTTETQSQGGTNETVTQ